MQTALAMLALNEPELDVERARAFVRETWPRERVGEIVRDETGVAFDLDEDFAAFQLIEAPIPWSDLEAPCAAAMTWPDAAKRMRGHVAHLLIAVAGDRDRARAKIERRLRLTYAVAAAAAVTRPAGIYWGEGRMVHEPDGFVARAKRASTASLPLDLWVDVRWRKERADRTTVFTTGMEPLGHREIEIVSSKKSPRELLPLVGTLIDYLAEKGPVIDDGSAFGRSEGEHIQVRMAPSVFSRGTVMRLEV